MRGKIKRNISEKILSRLEEANKDIRINPDISFKICMEAYELAKNNEMLFEQGHALIGLALVCRVKTEVTSCIQYSYSALEIFEESNETRGKVEALNLLGVAYFYNSMYEQALSNWLEALDILEKYKDYNLQSCILNNVGEVFKEAGKFGKAIKNYNSALEYAYKCDSVKNQAAILNNIGEIYFIQEKFEDAMEYYLKSYNSLIDENDMITLGEVENNLGKVNLINSNFEAAEDFLMKSINRLEKVNNKYYIIDSYINMGKLMAEKGHTDYFSYFEKAIICAEQSRAQKKLALAYKTIGKTYELDGNYKYALEYYKKYHVIDQSILTSLAGNRLEILKIEFQHIKEKEQLKKFKIINQRLETEIYNQRNELEYVQKLNRKLEEKVNIDELTEIGNRRYINNFLLQSFEESLKTDEQILIYMIDIDHFKKYNDHWGHSEGDKCLKRVANAFKRIKVGNNTEVARYGGEEFIYYTSGLNYEEGIELGNKLRNEIERLGMKYNSEKDSPVLSISLGGIVAKAKHFTKIFDMLEIADKELYKVKNSGRNAVSLAEYINE